MRVEQLKWSAESGWGTCVPPLNPQLVLVFGEGLATQHAQIAQLGELFPSAYVTGCSTAGEIFNTTVLENGLIATAIEFEHTTVRGAETTLTSLEDSFRAGQALGQELEHEGLTHVLVLSEGLMVNGSELVKGLHTSLPEGVIVTGGLSGDGDRFRETVVIQQSLQPSKHIVSCVGFYGSHLQVGYGSFGGWSPFGTERMITRAQGNVLYELDGKSALDVYKRYLGDLAVDLPASGLHFPLRIHTDKDPEGLVRTILSVCEEEGSLTFAGDIPVGGYARLMSANLNRLVDGAGEAAKQCQTSSEGSPQFALLISCVGRKMVLKQQVEEEVEAVAQVLGEQTTLTGFYSYGEISPHHESGFCHLHNQTMTITTFSESE